MNVDLSEKIPNNVNLSNDKRLQRALEHWQPSFLGWWKDMGPERYQENDVYLRTAISVDSAGWANFDYVRMPEYRWGIFLAAPEKDRGIGFGDHAGQPAQGVAVLAGDLLPYRLPGVVAEPDAPVLLGRRDHAGQPVWQEVPGEH